MGQNREPPCLSGHPRADSRAQALRDRACTGWEGGALAWTAEGLLRKQVAPEMGLEGPRVAL